MKRVSAVALLVMLLYPCFSEASDDTYVFISGGVNLIDTIDMPVFFENESVNSDVEVDTKSGLSLNGGAGLRISDNYRLEAELGYRSAEIDTVDITHMYMVDKNVYGGSGDIACFSAMVNAWYDFTFMKYLVPYVGIGIGAGQVRIENFSMNWIRVRGAIQPNQGEAEFVDDNNWQFAFQAGIGVGIELMKNLSLDLGYRYFATTDPEFTDTHGNKFSIKYNHSDFLAGIKFLF